MAPLLLTLQFPPQTVPLLAATRGHWRIENSLHWVLDVAFRERMNVVFARAIWRATWRSNDAWRTPCCVAIPRPVWASRTSGSRPDAIQLAWKESCSRSDFAVALRPSPSWPRPRSWSGPTRLRSSTSRRCPRCACVSSNSCGTPRPSRRCPGALNFLLPMAPAMA